VDQHGILIGRTLTAQTSLGFRNPNAATPESLPEALWYRGEGHLLTVAPTGAGKSMGCVIPALTSVHGSVVVLDPKGEAYRATWKRRQDLGQRVVRLDPFGAGADSPLDAGFNPFDMLPFLSDDREVACRMLAELIMHPDSHKTDPFWRDSSVGVLAGLIDTYERASGYSRSLAALVSDFAVFCPGQRNLGEIEPGEGLLSRLRHNTELLLRMEASGLTPEIVAAAAYDATLAYAQPFPAGTDLMERMLEAVAAGIAAGRLDAEEDAEEAALEAARAAGNGPVDSLDRLALDLAEEEDGEEHGRVLTTESFFEPGTAPSDLPPPTGDTLLAIETLESLGYAVDPDRDFLRRLREACTTPLDEEDIETILSYVKDPFGGFEDDENRITFAEDKGTCEDVYPLAIHRMANASSFFARSTAQSIGGTPDKTWGSILATLRSDLAQFTGRRMARFLHGGFDASCLRNGEAVSVYIVFPPTRIRSHPSLFRLMVEALAQSVLARAELPEHPTLFLLDEVAQLGRLEFLLTAQTMLRGFGVQVWSFWQDTSQLRALYPNEWKTLLHNSKVIQVFGRNLGGQHHDLSEALDIAPEQLSMMAPGTMMAWVEGGKPQRLTIPMAYADPDVKGLCDFTPHAMTPKAR
jgi:Type IV secretory system Conjugative DNA transfer